MLCRCMTAARTDHPNPQVSTLKDREGLNGSIFGSSIMLRNYLWAQWLKRGSRDWMEFGLVLYVVVVSRKKRMAQWIMPRLD